MRSGRSRARRCNLLPRKTNKRHGPKFPNKFQIKLRGEVEVTHPTLSFVQPARSWIQQAEKWDIITKFNRNKHRNRAIMKQKGRREREGKRKGGEGGGGGNCWHTMNTNSGQLIGASQGGGWCGARCWVAAVGPRGGRASFRRRCWPTTAANRSSAWAWRGIRLLWWASPLPHCLLLLRLLLLLLHFSSYLFYLFIFLIYFLLFMAGFGMTSHIARVWLMEMWKMFLDSPIAFVKHSLKWMNWIWNELVILFSSRW